MRACRRKHARSVCRPALAGSEQLDEQVYVPLAPIADWFVRAWPALCFEERAGLFSTRRELHADLSRWVETPPGEGLTRDEWLDLREGWWGRQFLAAGAEGALLPNLAFLRDDEELVVGCGPVRIAGERRLEVSAPVDDRLSSVGGGAAGRVARAER